MRLLPYVTAATLQGIPLLALASMDYKVNPTIDDPDDVKISKDGGAQVAIGTTPDPQPDGSSLVRVILSEGNLTCKVATITFVDQTSPKEWEDQRIIVETYGHPLSQHPNIGSHEVMRAVGASQD